MPAPTGREVLARGGAALKGAITGGGVREASAAIPSAPARDALLHAYQVAFASTFDHLMIIGVVVAAIGSICAYALVRERDFVPSYAPRRAHHKSNRRRRRRCDGGRGRPAGATPDHRDGPATSGPPRAITEAALRQLAERGLRPDVDGEHRRRGRRGPGHGLPPLQGQSRPHHRGHRRQPRGPLPRSHPRTTPGPTSSSTSRPSTSASARVASRWSGLCSARATSATPWRCTANGSSSRAPATCAPCLCAPRSSGSSRPTPTSTWPCRCSPGSVLARRVSGVPSPPDWAPRAVDMIWQRPPAAQP